MMTTSKWTNNLPGFSAQMIQPAQIPVNTNSGNWNIVKNNSNALSINIGGEEALTFHTDGTISGPGGTIKVKDLIQIINLMQKFIIDVSQDEETASKYPYIKDMAHSWLINELKGK